MTREPEIGDVIGLPNSDYVGIVVGKPRHCHAWVRTYSRCRGWVTDGKQIKVNDLDMYDPPADTPDHIYAEAMKIRLLT